jgi:hypothetical protein
MERGQSFVERGDLAASPSRLIRKVGVGHLAVPDDAPERFRSEGNIIRPELMAPVAGHTAQHLKCAGSLNTLSEQEAQRRALGDGGRGERFPRLGEPGRGQVVVDMVSST